MGAGKCEIIEVQKQQEARFLCSSCGADRGCNCNAPAVPKAKQALAAIEANPTRSDRAIAADIGASHTTVQKARKEVEATGNQLPVERLGLDGKTRKQPRHVTDDPTPDEDEWTEADEAKLERDTFLSRCGHAKGMAVFNGQVDEEVMAAADSVAEKWTALAAFLRKSAAKAAPAKAKRITAQQIIATIAAAATK